MKKMFDIECAEDVDSYVFTREECDFIYKNRYFFAGYMCDENDLMDEAYKNARDMLKKDLHEKRINAYKSNFIKIIINDSMCPKMEDL